MEATHIKIKNIMIVCMMLILAVSLATAAASAAEDTNAQTNENNLTVQDTVQDTVIEEPSHEIVDNEPIAESNKEDALSASSDDKNELLRAGSNEEILTGTSDELYTLIYYENTYLDLGDDYSLTYAVSINNKNGLFR